jgi:dimethylargininase
VGGSRRTNRAGVEQLADFARGCGLEVAVAEVPDSVLHLQTDVTALAGDLVVGSASMLAQPAFRSVRRRVVVSPEEAQARNVLAVGATAVLPAGCPATAAAVAQLGLEVREVELDEVYKADGGATCLSLLV